MPNATPWRERRRQPAQRDLARACGRCSRRDSRRSKSGSAARRHSAQSAAYRRQGQESAAQESAVTEHFGKMFSCAGAGWRSLTIALIYDIPGFMTFRQHGEDAKWAETHFAFWRRRCDQSVAAPNVSQLLISPEAKPALNQRARCAEVP